MRAQEYLEEMKNLQKNLLCFIEGEDNIEETFQTHFNILNEEKTFVDKHKLRELLHLISNISNNHYRQNGFFSKIEQIILIYKENIKNNFSNFEIFNIFKDNKRILLFLHEENIMKIDEYLTRRFTSKKYLKMSYPLYFLPEIKPYIKRKWFSDDEIKYDKLPKELFDSINKELPEDFYENRKKGENESYICKLIQTDSIKDFIVYINKNNYSLNSKIKPSIYETNPFLVKNQNKSIQLIEYAAFFGSIQIFNYLQINNVKLTNSLWLYSIHGKNSEIIHFLEENNIDPPRISSKYQPKKNYNDCYKEAIKCHHNDIADYIICNYFENGEEKLENFVIQYFKYFNFNFIQNEMINDSRFYDFCQYDHYLFAYVFVNEKEIDINKTIKRTELKEGVHYAKYYKSILNIKFYK